MAVASIWRRAWMGSKGGGGVDADDGGRSLRRTSNHSTTSGTTYTASTTTATSDSIGEARPRDFYPCLNPLSTAPVGEENAELDPDKELEKEMAKKLEHIKGLVTEFHGDKGGAVQWWLSELGVDWVLQLAETNESAGGAIITHHFPFLVESWMLALGKIAESILTTLDEGKSKQPQESAPEFAQLVQATVLKMLPFVGISAAKTTDDRLGAVEKLQVLIDMHEALSMVLKHILSLLSCVKEECSDSTMRELLSAYLTKLDEAILVAIVDIRNNIMAWTWPPDDRSSTKILKVTNSILSYAKVLWANYGPVNRILGDADTLGEIVSSENQNVSHVTNLIIETVSSLEKRPSTKSFPDESLRFLFLINNFYYLSQQFHTIWRFDFTMESLYSKIYDYICSYLHVSWDPVLKCLQDPASPRCFSRYSSPLSKFESKFHKTCATQKLWKVPDPKMRRRLRQAITNKVIQAFTQFLEANSIVTPRLTPREVEKMLEHLFEG